MTKEENEKRLTRLKGIVSSLPENRAVINTTTSKAQ